MDFTTDYRMLIDGALETGSATFDVVNPATEAVIGRAPAASRANLDRAVAAARRAFPAWSALPIAERKARLKELGDAVFGNAEGLGQLLTAEQGKPAQEAAIEVMGSGYWLQAYMALDLPVTVNEDTEERLSETRRVPLGVGLLEHTNAQTIMRSRKPVFKSQRTFFGTAHCLFTACLLRFGRLGWIPDWIGR